MTHFLFFLDNIPICAEVVCNWWHHEIPRYIGITVFSWRYSLVGISWYHAALYTTGRQAAVTKTMISWRRRCMSVRRADISRIKCKVSILKHTQTLSGNIKRTTSVPIANAFHLEGRPTLRQLFWAGSSQICTAQKLQLLIKILTSALDSVTRCSKNGNNLAIRRRFHAVTLTFDTWPWTTVVPNLNEIEQSVAELLTN